MAEQAIPKLAELGSEDKRSSATSVRRSLRDERTPSLAFQM
jgi:hypothetical protein